MQRRVLIGFLLGLCGVVFFGATLPMTRLALDGLSPAFIAFGRATVGGVLALALILVLRRPWPLASRKTMRDLALVAACLVFGFPLLVAVASQSVPAAHGGVVLGLLSLFAASLAGAVLVAVFTLRHGGGGALGLGDSLLVLGVVLCGIGYAISGRLTRIMSGWEVIAFTLVLSLPFMLIGALLTAPAPMRAVGAPAWVSLLYLGVFSQFVGFFFWNAGLAMGGIARVGQAQLLQPFVTAGLAWPLNGERPEPETLLFAAGVVAIVAFAQRTRQRPGVHGSAPPS